MHGAVALMAVWLPVSAALAEAVTNNAPHWAFQPITEPAVPVLPGRIAGVTHPVDAFLQAKLAEHGLEPAAPAEKRTLLRRLTYVLTGLPPAPAEIAAFLADDAPGAFDRLADRLLASPRFGERWARHWMDLMRYAETHGSEGDPEIPQAWRYRDYLIRAFNADVPCDQLIREHIAGDLLPHPRLNAAEGLNESALGISHFRLLEHGFQPVDALDEQVKTLDNQIDVLSKAFQALTISCARCHDHKFDPIRQREYYALYGVLLSCRPAQVVVDAPGRGDAQRAELRRLKERLRAALAGAWSNAASRVAGQLEDARTLEAELARQAARVTDWEGELAALEAAARANAFVGQRPASTSTFRPAPQPAARWGFDDDARDAVGGLHAELLGGAALRNGRLIVNGQGAFARTVPLARELRAKTLEVWLALPTLDQSGGGAITIETGDGVVFDSIVFAEQEPRRWMAGSDLHRRTRSAGGPEESAGPGELIHLAIAWHADGRIALFRNGRPYGASYRPEGPHAALRDFQAGNARVLFGQRHTGGGQPFLNAEIEEARLYDRALDAEEVAASFSAGADWIAEEQIVAALSPEQRARRAVLLEELKAARVPQSGMPGASRWREELAAAVKQPEHPLHAWAVLRDRSDFASGWRELAARWRQRLEGALSNNAAITALAWEFAPDASNGWFRHGGALPANGPGEFAVEPEGARLLTGLLPAGVMSHPLAQKEPGLFASPPFRVETDFISFRAAGGRGAQVRLIVDGYPLGNNSVYPRADLDRAEPGWTRLNVAYRKGAMAYLEFSTAEDATRRGRAAGPDGRSWFSVGRVVMHPAGALQEEPLAASLLFERGEPASARELADRIGRTLADAVAAWREGTMTEAQRAWLDGFVRRGLLPTAIDEVPGAAPLIAEYRRVESDLPTPRRAPGLVEATALDAPFLPRGDHLKPGERVPRGYLQVANASSFDLQHAGFPSTGPDRESKTGRSGRLELAHAIVSRDNPLTARVMANRVWQQLFGRGLAPTVDNFGRLGGPPTHPELLDYVATRFVREGWSHKKFIRWLVTSRAWQAGSKPSGRALELDPANAWLSHARVRKLEAEAVRDSLLAVSGRLDDAMFGPGVNALAPPAEQRQRSVYLTIRRGALNPFLEVFDAPRPFTTLGQRDETNVPAQSLALLNDPFVLDQAGTWAAALVREDGDAAARVRRMFERALGRLPTERELATSHAYLDDLARAHDAGEKWLQSAPVWRDFAQSLFNLKEFIYVR